MVGLPHNFNLMVWTLLFERYGVLLAVTALHTQEGLMKHITTIGLDLAKSVFQLHGMDHEGRAVLRKKVRRGQVLKFFATLPPCLVGMEACGSAHHWARELSAQGHQVRLIPPH